MPANRRHNRGDRSNGNSPRVGQGGYRPPSSMGTITAAVAGMMVVPMLWARALLVEAANLWKDQSDKRVVGQTNRPVFSRDQPSLKVPSNRTTAGDNQSLSPDPKAIMEIRPSRF